MAVDKDILADGSLVKSFVQPSKQDGAQRPVAGDRVTVHHKCSSGNAEAEHGHVIDDSRDRDQPFTFTLGRGEVIPAWEHGVLTMEEGEIATFDVDPELAYGQASFFGATTPSTSSRLRFELELLSIESRGTDVEEPEMDSPPEERLEVAMRSKDGGTSFFKEGQLESALEAYRRALRILGFPDCSGEVTETVQAGLDAAETNVWVDGALRQARNQLAFACQLNCCQCCLKLERNPEAFQHGSAAVDLDPTSAKALYRRGSAAMVLDLLDDARANLTEAARREPANREIREQLKKCDQRRQAAVASGRDTFGKMFGGPAVKQAES